MDPNNLAQAFAVWAAVVGLVGAALVFELSHLRGEVLALTAILNGHIVETEHRLTTVEADVRRMSEQ